MARVNRRKSETGFYHVMLRGNERKVIFHDDTDKAKFMEILRKIRIPETLGPLDDNSHRPNPMPTLPPRFNLYAYCLMDNHIHLMLSQGSEDISTAIKRISVSYVSYFNKKYNRVGHLFQDRYKSEIINGEAYLLALSRYIHLNPVKANLVSDPQDYPWTSYRNYLRPDAPYAELMDASLVLNYFSKDNAIAMQQYREYMMERVSEETDGFLEIDDRPELSEQEELAAGTSCYIELLREYGISGDDQLQKVPWQLVHELKRKTNLSLRKISQVTGMSKDRIRRMLEKGQAK